MTQSLSGSTPGDPKKVWLNRFLNVHNKVDREIYDALMSASEAASAEVMELYSKPGIGATVRRAQLTGASGVITKVLHALFGEVGTIVKNGSVESSQAAVRAANVWDDKILKQIIPDKGKRDVFRAGLETSAGRNVDALIQRQLGEKIPLSRRVYRSEALARRQIDRVVESGLAKGDGAEDIAKKAKAFINPRTPGGATYAARRLGRTEINNAFHAQSIRQMESRPWVSQAEWRLSGSHTPDPGDRCEQYARIRVYPASGIPRKPHPQCFCYITPVVPDIDFILHEYRAGRYSQYLAETVPV